MAGSTGLEPATSGLTVQCANQAAPRARYTDQLFSERNSITPAGTGPEHVPRPTSALPALHRDALMGAPGALLDDRRLIHASHPDVRGLAARHRVRSIDDLPLPGFIRDAVADL